MVQNMAGCGGGIRLGNSVEDQNIHNVTIWGQKFSDHCEVCYACRKQQPQYTLLQIGSQALTLQMPDCLNNYY